MSSCCVPVVSSISAVTVDQVLSLGDQLHSVEGRAWRYLDKESGAVSSEPTYGASLG